MPYKTYFNSFDKKILVGLALLTFLVYVNGLDADFVSDDRYWFLQNPNLGNWSWLLQMPDRVGTWVIYFLAHAIGGLNPFFYRLPNLLFHIASALTIFLLMRALGGRRLAIFTSLLFAVHPILVESVTWIAGGSHAMYSLWIISALLFYILYQRDKNIKLYYSSVAAAFFSIFFSEKAVILAAIFFLYELTFGNLPKNWQRLLPYFGVSALLIFIQVTKFGTRIEGLTTFNYAEPGLDNPLIQVPIAMSEYLKLIFYPKDLTLYHSEMFFTQTQYLLRLAVFLLFSGLILFSYFQIRGKNFKLMIKFWQKIDLPANQTFSWQFLFFWLLFFIIALSPTLTPFRISWIVAERYVYLGSLGIFAVIGLALDKLNQNQKLRTLIYVVYVLYVLFLSWRTVQRNIDWKNEDNLWIATAKTSPSDPKTHNNLGDVYARHGDLEKATQEFQLATQINPSYADAYHNLANTYQKMSEQNKDKSQEYLNLAIENYRKAIEFNPLLWQSYQNLGAIYFEKEDFETAIKYFAEAVKINPSDLNLKFNLGIIHLKAGKKDTAQAIFLEILKVDPGNQAVLNLLGQIK